MLAELFFVTAQACQNGQCPPTTKDSSVVATTVTVVNCRPLWLAYYDTTKKTYDWQMPKHWRYRPITTCCGGKCK
jgi:hypothetical protein